MNTNIIEKEKRPRPVHKNIVDAVINKVFTDRAVAICHKGQFDFCPYRIGGGDKHRRFHCAEISLEKPAE